MKIMKSVFLYSWDVKFYKIRRYLNEKTKNSIVKYLIRLLIVQSIEVLALQRSNRIPNYYYHSDYTTDLQPYANITFRNGIDSTKKEAGAESWSNYPFTSTSVDATFYWFEVDNLHQIIGTGTSHGFDGAQGGSATEAPSLTGVLKYYYQVISDHTASCSGPILYYPSLTTFEP